MLEHTYCGTGALLFISYKGSTRQDWSILGRGSDDSLRSGRVARRRSAGGRGISGGPTPTDRAAAAGRCARREIRNIPLGPLGRLLKCSPTMVAAAVEGTCDPQDGHQPLQLQ